MSIITVESFESQEITRTIDDATLEIKAHILGTEDTAAAEAAFLAWLPTNPATVGAKLKQTRVAHLGGGVHEGTANYLSQAPGIVKTIRYRTTGQTARVIQGFGSIYSQGLNGPAPNFNGLVGVTRDGVEGVDVPVPTFAFSIDFHFSALSQSYLTLCHFLTGCMNSAPYLGYAAGELLFHGIEGEISIDAGGAIVLGDSPISFNFEASPNLTNIPVGPFVVPFKFGWDYLWPRTVETEHNNAVIRRTESVHVDRVLRIADLSLLGV